MDFTAVNPMFAVPFEKGRPYSLGLDLGANSLGWGILDQDNLPIACGVRIFPEGTKRDRGPGSKEASRATDRRMARMTRRQGERRRRRWRKTAHILAEFGLLPTDPTERQALLLGDPYQIRSRGLEEKLELHEIGRAIYHMSKRRGFLSSRKAADADESDKDGKVVYEGIKGLEEKMEQTGAKSLGQYLATVDAHQERLRKRYLHRNMIREEFAKLLESQGRWHRNLFDQPLTPTQIGKAWADVTEMGKRPEKATLRQALEKAIFYQRPLKSQKHRIGSCPLVPSEQRAPRASWYAQQVRMLQEVANLLIIQEDGTTRPLSAAQRKDLIELMMDSFKKITFQSIRKKFKLDPALRFNLEEAQRKDLQPQWVEAGLRSMLGPRWHSQADLFRFEIWPQFCELEDEDFDAACVENGWKLEEEDKKHLGKIYRACGDAYGSYSDAALMELIPHLEEGKNLHDSIAAAFPQTESVAHSTVLPGINPDTITNPVVKRCLSETRKVVNAIIRHYGVPTHITVELAREARGTMPQRNEAIDKMRKNEKDRERIKATLLAKNISPSHDAILRYRLFEECKNECPYTSKAIAFEDVFGQHPRFDVEHILPYSRSMDDSMGNKTLCDAAFNREVKRNRTPWEIFNAGPVLFQGKQITFEEVQMRVRHSQMDWRKKKLFTLDNTKLNEDFKASQLTDTSYAAKEVRKYLQQLGIPVDTVKGHITARLRHEWGLNSLLHDRLPPDAKAQEKIEKLKVRLDHRHHAIDALTIAGADQKAIQHMAMRCEKKEKYRAALPHPEFRPAIERLLPMINVSHRVDHKLNSGFAKETNYGRIDHPFHGEVYVTRKNLDTVVEASQGFLESVCDETDRETIAARFRQLGWSGGDYKLKLDKMWYADLRKPCRTGPGPLMKKVRIWMKQTFMIPAPQSEPTRFIAPEDNHHLALYQGKDAKGKKAYYFWLCTRYEALRRKKAGLPIVAPTHPNEEYGNGHLVLWLMKNDQVVYTLDDGSVGLYRVQKFTGPPSTSSPDLILRAHTEATVDILEDPPFRLRIRSTNPTQLEAFGRIKITKISNSPIGMLESCNDTPDC